MIKIDLSCTHLYHPKKLALPIIFIHFRLKACKKPLSLLLMSVFLTALASGSNGNCYYVGNEQDAVLIDAGLSCREIERRMARLQLSMHKVRGVFVSHEHTDHIRGIEALVNRFSLPLYISEDTCQHARLKVAKAQLIYFNHHQTIAINDLSIVPFSKQHDAVDPYSFTVSCKDITVGVFTDVGVACENLIYHFKQCHAAFLEANYDEEMLDNGSYPYHLKARIKGGKGHLSNREALALFTTHKHPQLSHLFLSHLSKNNNDPLLVQELFNTHAGGVKIIVASRYEETPLYRIDIANTLAKLPSTQPAKPQQMKLVFE